MSEAVAAPAPRQIVEEVMERSGRLEEAVASSSAERTNTAFQNAGRASERPLKARREQEIHCDSRA